MNRVWLLVAALLLVASAAWSESGIQLSVGDCSVGSSVSSITNSCKSNAGPAFDLVASCVLPAVTIRQFFSAPCRLVIQFPNLVGDVVPDWWRGDGNGCRAAGFYAYPGSRVGASCQSVWDAHPVPIAGLWPVLDPDGHASRIEFSIGAYVPYDSAYDLVGDGVTEWSVVDLQVQRLRTVGPGSCAGCEAGACIALTEMDLIGLADIPDFLKLTKPYVRNWVTYQSTGVPPCPASVPVKNRTWGALKSLYR